MNKSIIPLNGEVWKAIPQSNKYQVSNKGRVRIVQGKECRIAFVRVHKRYPTIRININKKPVEYRVHRLVANAFLGKPTAETVNHIDGNRENNCVENLEYASVRENNLHAFRLGLNKPIVPKGTSGSLYFHKRSRKWVARYTNNKIEHHIGLYDCKIEAIKALVIAMIKLRMIR